MTESQMNKMLVDRLQKAEAQIRDLKSTVRCTTQAATDARGGLQVRKESQSHVEGLRDAVHGLLHIIEESTMKDEFTNSITFAKKVLFLTEGATF